MLVDSISMITGAVLDNGVIENGNALPSVELSSIGQLFYLNASGSNDGLYVFNGISWNPVANSSNTINNTSSILFKGLLTDSYISAYESLTSTQVSQIILANVGSLDADISISINPGNTTPGPQYEIFHAAQLQYGQTIIIDTFVTLEPSDQIFIKCSNAEAIISVCVTGITNAAAVKLLQGTCTGIENVMFETITNPAIVKNFMLCNTGTTTATISLWIGQSPHSSTTQILKDLSIAVGETIMGDFELPINANDIIAMSGSSSVTVSISGILV